MKTGRLVTVESDGGEDSSPLRVLVLAPTSKDADVTADLLIKSGLICHLCQSLQDLILELPGGAGAVLLTEDIVFSQETGDFLDALRRQPSWSELPVVMLMRGAAQSPGATRVLDALSNVTLLERPAPMRSVISAVRAAVRGRQRQYQIRDQLEAISRGEMALRESQERLRLAVATARLGVWSLDLRTLVLSCSDGCKANYGRAATDPFAYADFWQAVHPDDLARIQGEVQHAIEHHTDYDTEYRTIWPGGAIHWVIVRGRPTYLTDGTPSEMSGVSLDITDRKTIEQEREHLFESERAARTDAERANRTKDEFLATLSHELRTPLNAILGWAQLLGRGSQTPADLKQGLETIERNAKAQTQLIEDLLDMSRIISGKIRLDIHPIDPATFVAVAIDTVRPAAEAKEILLATTLDPSVGLVAADSNRLQQIAWNLLSNAVKFTPRGGVVQIHLTRVEHLARLTVADNGRGMPAEFVPHVFDRFRQADASSTRVYGGLGLGLSIVKQLVELHGGSARAQSDGLNKGSTFIVDLPLALASPARAPRPSQERFPPTGRTSIARDVIDLSGLRVLVVDDEPDARALVLRLLTDTQAEVATAGSVAEALEVLSTFNPDILVSDIGMPVRGGFELIRDVRRLGRDGSRLPAIALTAYARSEDRDRALAAGFQAHLTKPLEANQLLKTIARLAGRKQPFAEAASAGEGARVT